MRKQLVALGLSATLLSGFVGLNNYYVTSAAVAQSASEANVVYSIKTDKTSYKPGDTVKVTVVVDSFDAAKNGIGSTVSTSYIQSLRSSILGCQLGIILDSTAFKSEPTVTDGILSGENNVNYKSNELKCVNENVAHGLFDYTVSNLKLLEFTAVLDSNLADGTYTIKPDTNYTKFAGAGLANSEATYADYYVYCEPISIKVSSSAPKISVNGSMSANQTVAGSASVVISGDFASVTVTKPNGVVTNISSTGSGTFTEPGTYSVLATSSSGVSSTLTFTVSAVDYIKEAGLRTQTSDGVKYILGISPTTTASSLVSKLSSQAKVLNASGSDISSSTTKVATGFKINTTYDNAVYIVILKGDINADGMISLLDINTIQKKILGASTLDTNQTLAADVNSDSRVNVSDIQEIQKHILGIKTITQ